MAGMRRLISWWQSLPLPWHPWRVAEHVAAVDEVPDLLPSRALVLVGARGRPTWAVFDCPCRTGHRLLLNLDRTRYPFWVIESRKPLSIRPSIDDITPKRRCHFIIRNGRLRWAIGTNRG